MHSRPVLHTDSIQDGGGHEHDRPLPAAPQSIFDCGEGILRELQRKVTAAATDPRGRREDEKKRRKRFHTLLN